MGKKKRVYFKGEKGSESGGRQSYKGRNNTFLKRKEKRKRADQKLICEDIECRSHGKNGLAGEWGNFKS